ncbi:glycosyl hydrolases family 17 protein, partial [Genlisea aurea]
AATVIGVTYNPSIPNLPQPEHVIPALHALRVSAVRMIEPTTAAVRAFAYTNITLLLSVPNQLVAAFAANRSASDLWLHSYVLPYYPRTRISIISVGSDVITMPSGGDLTVDSSAILLPAMRNLRLSLIDLGIPTISVSTTLSFMDIMANSFPPSSAEYHEPIGSLIVRPLLQFLDETNSSFMINLFPYNIYRVNSEIPVGYALFEENPCNYRDDVVTGVRYRNLFDMMVDAVIAAMAVSGKENLPVIVTETGWPSEAEVQSAGNYAEMYLKGLINHLRFSSGTPLRKEGPAEAYIYQLFDGGASRATGNGTSFASASSQHWGIMYPNLTMKYRMSFSAASRRSAREGVALTLLLSWIL